jgi:hypothetical protein
MKQGPVSGSPRRTNMGQLSGSFGQSQYAGLRSENLFLRLWITAPPDYNGLCRKSTISTSAKAGKPLFFPV